MEDSDKPAVAAGVWWTDPKDGTRRWMTGDQMLRHIRTAVEGERKDRKAAERQLDDLAYQLGQKFAEERERQRKDIAVLRREIETLQKALPLRAVKGGKEAA